MSAFSDAFTGIGLVFPTTPQVTLGFEPDTWVIENTGSEDLEFSFDGTNVDGVIGAAVATQSLARTEVNIKVKRLWLRAAANTTDARVRANNL